MNKQPRLRFNVDERTLIKKTVSSTYEGPFYIVRMERDVTISCGPYLGEPSTKLTVRENDVEELIEALREVMK